MWTSLVFFALATAVRVNSGSSGLPVDKVYGVNLGSWLVLEPWMLPNEWVSMGGDTCFETGSCADCAASEFDLVKKIGQTKADQVFQNHWETWFTQSDVNNIANAGLNTVRIPMGYWIIEDLVNRTTEFYPRGGIKQLKRGLQQLKNARINVLLDFHAMPGVSSSLQMFAGHCTSDVEFYTPPNYFRALQWAAVTTFISHVDPAFSTVFGIEAVNEPLMDSTQTPGYGDYLTDFTLVVRAMEFVLGITCPNVEYASLLKVSTPANSRRSNATASSGSSLSLSSLASNVGGRAGQILLSVIPIIADVSIELGVPNPLASALFGGLLGGVNRQCLHTTFMDVLWQNVQGFNPANAVQGPAMFDDHLYYNFGGVADPNPTAYMTSICNLPRVQNDTSLGNIPMVFGEWSIATNFNATDQFLTQWADAQKLMYSQSSGWIFWSFKIENGNSDQREWDYFTALEAGHFTKNPAVLNDPHVCDSFRT
ncbi:glycoside hydrolase family 5 protein [Sphaerobolus stellatus SS14]|uniref:Glycoside hydrolase family 5 protein n=1 Tax=Sphaerobolus stellatus (strain SS14) TaxID=990650 RepID=A0A0C9TLF9_SPHS4|nr:glycoside hydrolase family 5 protein [Sphaerobolus stellatus SS14]